MPSVFLSSVATGIEPYREVAYHAIEGLERYHCVRMEDFGARADTPFAVCADRIRECDVFVGIVGQRYGSMAPDTGKSYSESEYDRAVELGKPRLMFLAPESFPVPANLIEPDEVRERQAKFRAKVTSDSVVAFFAEEQELAGRVIQAIHNLRSQSIEERTIIQGPTITRLLFPFASNRAGFDTGISISNISRDPFGTEVIDGTCTVHFYGSFVEGTGTPRSVQTSGLVRAGETITFTLSNGGQCLISNMPSFQGYVIAECRFRAVGFAVLSDVGMQRMTTGYIAQAM
jgi:hypothetical protein